MTLVVERALNGGTQKIYRFDNGYGASLIEGGIYAYGGREIAVLYFEEGAGDFEGEISYDTPITSDVVGYLTEEHAEEVLEQIRDLPVRELTY